MKKRGVAGVVLLCSEQSIAPILVTSPVETPVPTTRVIASIASVAVIGIELLVYFKKRKR
jgi:hypothetical protein